MVLKKIVSGGQTGVDRAALDTALSLEIPCGGWCPAGRRAEDGPIDARYPLEETPSANYAVRTEWNVRDSDGTLILTIGKPTGGTRLTATFARRQGKPCLVVDLDSPVDVSAVADWLRANTIEALNVAGPRGSQQSDLYGKAAGFLRNLLQYVTV